MTDTRGLAVRIEGPRKTFGDNLFDPRRQG